MKPKAVELFEMERDTMDQSASIALEHPMDRLKYHILQTKGKILRCHMGESGQAIPGMEFMA
jgi:hypothetical protein